ncbi:DUF1611 domain-containing protein [Sulfurovum riftiae]|uniref:EBNA-1 nuclear protein n=1 Tax=Sulfurovum riftiae TaxID=1630136 RepID=A0A151CE19_9BACT|nr:DUF1611 domain-containing protein [Sulfurovum riftiae]KYJ85761.1 EBNA-1 nuclear protein [Sulfurovum riftiae]
MNMDKKNAIVYSEALFGEMDGKTANGLVRYSEKYNIVGVIDSTKAGLDALEYLDGIKSDIHIYKNLEDAVQNIEDKIEVFIYGIAPLSGDFSDGDISLMKDAMRSGMSIVNGLHTFLTDDASFMQEAQKYGVEVADIRKYQGINFKRVFSGDILKVTAPRIAVLGTDGAIGKRTTATIIMQELKKEGLNAIMISTGQTGLIQGAKYGAPMDAMQGHFAAGVIEGEILRAWEEVKPDIFIIEGQGALTHPAYLSSCAISRGSQANGIILQHAPKREVMGDFPQFPMPTLKHAIALNEMFTSAPVLGITINHENMSDQEIQNTIQEYENVHSIPTTDVVKLGAKKIAAAIMEHFNLQADNSDA